MAMLRIFKHYELNLALPGVASRKLSFSSYPGECARSSDHRIKAPGANDCHSRQRRAWTVSQARMANNAPAGSNSSRSICLQRAA